MTAREAAKLTKQRLAEIGATAHKVSGKTQSNPFGGPDKILVTIEGYSGPAETNLMSWAHLLGFGIIPTFMCANGDGYIYSSGVTI